MTEFVTSAAAVSHVLPEAARKLLQRELDDDEQLVWWGQPVPALLVQAVLPPLAVVLVWAAVALFVIATVILGPPVMLVWAPGLVIAGAAAVRSTVQAWRAAHRTTYVLTDRRALVIAPSTKLFARRRLEVVSYVPADDMSRTTDVEGRGDVVFAKVKTPRKHGYDMKSMGFMGITNAVDVERLVRLTLVPSSSTPPPQR